MGEDDPAEGALPLSQQFAIHRDHWLRRFGVEIYRDYCMDVYLRGRWRFIWHNPRFRESWQIDTMFDDLVWQVGIGPAMIVYCRGEM